VLGIGDRHLENFMLEKSTGRVVGIDFGHAFGSATFMLPTPELMAVRLTRQMTSFLQPLDTGALLKEYMALALRALRSRRVELMRVMDIFISEPLLDWGQHARKLDEKQRKSLAASADEEGASAASVDVSASAPVYGSAGSADALATTWARERVNGVRRKLEGHNSAHITISELEASCMLTVRKDLEQLKQRVLGPRDSLRRQKPSRGLSVEEQIDVLVEQATDPAILSRTFQGWRPWL